MPERIPRGGSRRFRKSGLDAFSSCRACFSRFGREPLRTIQQLHHILSSTSLSHSSLYLSLLCTHRVNLDPQHQTPPRHRQPPPRPKSSESRHPAGRPQISLPSLPRPLARSHGPRTILKSPVSVSGHSWDVQRVTAALHDVQTRLSLAHTTRTSHTSIHGPNSFLFTVDHRLDKILGRRVGRGGWTGLAPGTHKTHDIGEHNHHDWQG